MKYGKKDRTLFFRAMEILRLVIEQTQDTTLVTDGELFIILLHYTTKKVPAVDIGILERRFSWKEVLMIQKAA